MKKYLLVTSLLGILSNLTHAQLSGNKTIGNGGDYINLKAAFDDINLVGLNGDLTLLIISDITIPTGLQASLNQWTETSGSNFSLKILPKNGVWTIRGSIENSSLINFTNTKNISIDGDGTGGSNKNLTIINNTDNMSTTIGLNGTNNTTIKNCTISTGGPLNDSKCISLSSMGNNYVTIENNTLKSSSYGIKAEGNLVGLSGNLKIKNNIIGDSNDNLSISNYGIYCNHYSVIEIFRNEIFNIKSEINAFGIKIENSDQAVIASNNIHDIFYSGSFGLSANGIFLSNQYSNPNFVIKNNIIRHLGGRGWDSAKAPCGIYIQTGANSISTGVDIINNTIELNADTSWGVYSLTKPKLNVASIWLQGIISGVKMQNNIFSNSLGSRTDNLSPTFGYAVYCNTNGILPFSVISNNIYNVTNHNNNFIGYNNGTNLDFTAWKTWTSDINSKETDPLFVSDTNINLQNCSPALLNGTPINTVTEDFYNYSRSFTPTIGAIENIIQAYDIIPNLIDSTSISVSWTNGNICHRTVWVSKNQTGSVILNQETTYIANSTFGSGSQIGNWFCVYDGNGSEAVITGLDNNSTYRIIIYEYNNNIGKEIYHMAPAINNPINFNLSTLGLVLNTKTDEIKIHPNPANDYFKINVSEKSEIAIYTITGQLKFIKETNKNDLISISNLEKGVYFVKIVNSNTFETKKLIVN